MVPRRPPRRCCWTAPPGEGCRADPVQVETLTSQQVRRAGMVCDVLRRLAWTHNRARSCTLIYLIIIGGCAKLCSVQRGGCIWVSVEVLHLTVCPPAWRRRHIGGLCGCCIVWAGIGQINEKPPVKPCKQFWRLGCINCMGSKEAFANACM